MQKIIYLEKGDAAELPATASEAERLEAAVRWINRKVETTVHFGLLQIGYYLLNHFFDGDIELALSRNPHKQNSFRRLCQRPDLLISSTHLVSSVKLVVQERQVGREPDFQQLPVSHKIALLSVTDVREKKALARKAVREKLSVRALTREVRGRRVGNTVAADEWARKLRRALDTVTSLAEEPNLDGLTPAEAAKLDQAVSDARRCLQSTLANLRGIRSVAV